MESVPITLAFLIDWSWLRIGPHIQINIDPVLLHIGPLALHWYGLMYVVAIVVGLWCIRRYIARKGISQDQVYRMLWWCIVAGLVGGRLYYVIQQPDLVSDYAALVNGLRQPQQFCLPEPGCWQLPRFGATGGWV